MGTLPRCRKGMWSSSTDPGAGLSLKKGWSWGEAWSSPRRRRRFSAWGRWRGGTGDTEGDTERTGVGRAPCDTPVPIPVFPVPSQSLCPSPVPPSHPCPSPQLHVLVPSPCPPCPQLHVPTSPTPCPTHTTSPFLQPHPMSPSPRSPCPQPHIIPIPRLHPSPNPIPSQPITPHPHVPTVSPMVTPCPRTHQWPRGAGTSGGFGGSGCGWRGSVHPAGPAAPEGSGDTTKGDTGTSV